MCDLYCILRLIERQSQANNERNYYRFYYFANCNNAPIHLYRLLRARFLSYISSIVLSVNSHCETWSVDFLFISELYTIREFYLVQHLAVCNILTQCILS